MSATVDVNDDDYIAGLLAKDARDSSLKYSSMGMSAFLPTKRPNANGPRPNKRFLGNLLRETDSHNAALKKKEELEARMRARGENLAPSRSGKDKFNFDKNWDAGRERKRQRGEESSVRRRRSRSRSRTRSRSGSRDRKRRKTNDRSEDSRRERPGIRRGHRHDNLDTDYGHDRVHRSRRRERHRSRSSGYSNSPDRRHRTDRKPDQKHQHRRSRSRSGSDRDNGNSRRHRRNVHYKSRRQRSRSTSSSRSRSPSGRKKAGSDRHVKEQRSRPKRRSPSPSASLDSDPLESIVGPLPALSKSAMSKDPPPLTSRGRGAYKPSTSTMDSHFSSSYDPSADLRVESEDEKEREDWDLALEALRDRELWKKKGAERLRAAGFGDEEIKKWEDSGKEKGVDDVKWTSRGEAREWDRGKVIESDGDRKGEVSLQAAWKRKGGGFLKDFKKALG